MTEEQIKQNAEEYASKLVERDYHEDIWLDLYDAHIAGAHSRDEEIKDLQLAYNNLVNSFNERGRELAKAFQELDKLRNPWISVKERLPEIEDEKEECTGEVFVCIKDGVYLVAHYSYFYKAWYAFDDRGGCMYRKIRTPRYWMPIPEVKKGE